MLASISIIFSSLSFWFGKVEIVANTVNSLMTNFATYPDGIFKGTIKILFYTIIPIGFINFLPVRIISEFKLSYLIIILIAATIFVGLAFTIFYKGLKKYGSSNLMNVRM